MSKKIFIHSFGHAVLAELYILAVVTLITNGEKLFGQTIPNILVPFAMLTLLVVSAAVMAILIFGRPVMMYIDNQKKDALKFLFSTVGALAVIGLFAFSILALVNWYVK